MPDTRILLANPPKLARALAKMLESGATLLDQMAQRTAEPTWHEIAVELDRLVIRLRERACGITTRRMTAPTIVQPS
jgi:hypothetical protein